MKPFTILSHNAFWFQGVPFPTDMPGAPDTEILRRLCEMYRRINPDVICLQEIQSQEAFEMVSEHLEMPGCYCCGKELPQYGGAVFWHAGRGGQLHDSCGSAACTQRMWQVVAVNGPNGSLRICNIHLPSQRQLSHERAAAQRLAELQCLIRSCESGPDVIVGDFNEQRPGPTGKCLESHGYVDAAVLSDDADVPTTISEIRIDYTWIKREMNDSVLTYDVAGKQELACVDTGKQYLSDHLPLWITVEYR